MRVRGHVRFSSAEGHSRRTAVPNKATVRLGSIHGRLGVYLQQRTAACCLGIARSHYQHMSVRQYSLHNPVPWTNGGGPGVPSLLRVLAQLKTKVSLLGVSVTI